MTSNSYIVTVRELELDNQIYTMLLTKSELSDLLNNVDDEKYELGDIMPTFAEKADSILPFCKVDKNLTTGENNDIK